MQVRKTTYKGIEFRSRLEARWAVFFDALGLRWEYEPEGYRLDDGTCYLPDFYVHDIKGHVGKEQHGNGIFIEVKGELTAADKNKLSRFQYPIYVVGNLPASKDPWVDVTIKFEENPRYVFSEYTVDGTEEELWFSKKGSQVYLIRWGEAKKNQGLDSCAGARDVALNKKFEYQNATENNDAGTNRNRQSDSRNRKNPFSEMFGGNLSNSGKSPFDFFGASYMKGYESPYSREKQKERGRIGIQAFKSMFLSMPGIREYRLADRIRFVEANDVPILCSIVVADDRDRKCLSVQYHYMEEGDNGILDNYFEYREILSVDLENKYEDETRGNYLTIKGVIETAVEWLKKEMNYYPADAQRRRMLDEEENKERERIREDIHRARLDREDEEKFLAEKNPYRIGQLVEAIKNELNNSDSSYTFRNILLTFRMAKDRNEDEMFGIGEYILDRRGDEVLMQMRRTYTGYSSTGRYYNKFDGREFFTIDANLLPETSSSMQHAMDRDKLMSEFRKAIDLAMKTLKTEKQ